MNININFEDLFNQEPPKLLVSCSKDPNDTAKTEGLYIVDFKSNNISKVLDADCGGIVSYNNGYFLATNSHGILNLDKDFNIVAQHEVPYLDVHGLKMDSNSLLYLAESTHNTIGIYQPEPFKRVDEIKISEHDFDYNHINDLWIEGNRLFVSMFSYHDAWRELDGVYDGVILEYNLEEKALVNILQKKSYVSTLSDDI